ncbi:hypothetical protein LCGC14_2204550 [marine sediment metagenome]|uniref:Uncharacterized protein n=1 Tax=marine sediment metagenome TaxID=412755 RepID=A0A0F9FT12_9ZZZZ
MTDQEKNEVQWIELARAIYSGDAEAILSLIGEEE